MSGFQLNSSFGFLSPWFLCLLPFGIGFLIYVYRKSGKRAPRKVGTTYLLKLIKRPPETNKRFIPPIHFWLELIALLSIIVGLSLPYGENDASRILILIDDSFSMRAVTEGRESLFRIAQKEAMQRIQEQPANTLIKVSSTSNSCVTDDFLHRQEAIEFIAKCEPTFTEDALDSLLLRLSQNEEYQKLLVFSDKEFSVGMESGKGTYYNLRSDSELRFLENFAISDASIGQEGAKVTVQSYLKNPKHGTISLNLGKIDGNGLRYYSSKKTEFIGKPGGQETIQFDFPDKDWDVLRFQIENSPDEKFMDAISEDNTFWLTRNNSKKILGVISHKKDSTLGLEKISQYEFKSLSPEEFAARKSEKFNAFIFNQVTPEILPDVSSLFILPSGNFLFHNSQEQENAVMRWENSSSLTKYVNFSLLSGSKGFSLDIPEWARGEIYGNKGTTLASGEFSNARYVASGIPLLPFNGFRTPALSILMLNILLDLTESFEYRVGELLSFSPEMSKIRYLDTLKNVSFPQIDSGLRTYSTEIPGILELSENNVRNTYLPVNFSSQSESDVRQVKSLGSAANEKRTDSEKTFDKQNISYVRHFISLAFLFLTLDLLLRLLRVLFKKGRFA